MVVVAVVVGGGGGCCCWLLLMLLLLLLLLVVVVVVVCGCGCCGFCCRCYNSSTFTFSCSQILSFLYHSCFRFL